MTSQNTQGANMLSVIENQKKAESINAAAAFRQAYQVTKLIKASLWGVTLTLATAQLLTAIIDKSKFDLTTFTIISLCFYVILGSFGKSQMLEKQILGCTLQSLHDYLTLGVGKRPSEFDLPPSKVKRLADKWFQDNECSKKEELATWWDKSLSSVGFPQARLICSCVTFYWEVELRKKYQLFLTLFLVASLLIPFFISLYFKFTAYEILLLAIAPFTPFLSLVLEEWLMNKNCLNTAECIRRNSQDVWCKLQCKSIDDAALMHETNVLMESWQTYRLSTLPIFEWLYRLTRRRMEDDMIVDTVSLVEQIK